MKNLLASFLMIALCGFASASFAQCSSTYSDPEAGLYPLPDSAPCIQRNLWQSFTINFKNYDTTRVAGNLITIDSVKIDTIGNLPCGFKWLSNKPRNTFANSDTGCILIWGKTTDAVGEYRLNIAVTAYIGGAGLPYNAANLGLRYDVRVIEQGSACPAIDTSAPTLTATCGDGTPSTFTGVNEIESSVAELSNYPNPFNGTTEVIFTAYKETAMTLRVYDVLGKTVYSKNFTSVGGRNSIELNAKNMEPGMYFYSVTDGNKTMTNRMVVTQ